MGLVVRWTVERLPLADESVDMVFTDPPYGTGWLHTYGWVAGESARVLRPGGFVAVMTGVNNLDEIFRRFADAGLRYYALYNLYLGGSHTGIVWRNAPGRKSMPVKVRLRPVLVFSKGPAVSRTPTVNLVYPGRDDKQWHTWGQAVDIPRYFIDCFTGPGDLVVDPMCGGGSTAVACELLGRRWIVGDVDPQAVEQTARRMNGGNGVAGVADLAALPLFADAEDIG